MPPACVLEGRGATAILRVASASQQNKGFPKGMPPWHTALLAKCSVFIPAVTAGGQNEGFAGWKRSFCPPGKRTGFADGDEQKPEPISGVAAGILLYNYLLDFL